MKRRRSSATRSHKSINPSAAPNTGYKKTAPHGAVLLYLCYGLREAGFKPGGFVFVDYMLLRCLVDLRICRLKESGSFVLLLSPNRSADRFDGIFIFVDPDNINNPLSGGTAHGLDCRLGDGHVEIGRAHV